MLKHRQRGNRRAQSASQAGRRLAALCSAAMCIFAPVPSASAATPTTFGPSANRACLVTAAHPDAELQMPTPKRLPVLSLMDYGYEQMDQIPSFHPSRVSTPRSRQPSCGPCGNRRARRSEELFTSSCLLASPHGCRRPRVPTDRWCQRTTTVCPGYSSPAVVAVNLS